MLREPAVNHKWVGSLLALGATADVMSTIVGLQAGLVETNPIAVSVLELAGWPGLIAFKLVIVAVLLAVVAVWPAPVAAKKVCVGFTGLLWFVIGVRNALLLLLF